MNYRNTDDQKRCTKGNPNLGCHRMMDRSLEGEAKNLMPQNSMKDRINTTRPKIEWADPSVPAHTTMLSTSNTAFQNRHRKPGRYTASCDHKTPTSNQNHWTVTDNNRITSEQYPKPAMEGQRYQWNPQHNYEAQPTTGSEGDDNNFRSS